MIKRRSSEKAEEQYRSTEDAPFDFLLGTVQARGWSERLHTHQKLALEIKGESVATPPLNMPDLD